MERARKEVIDTLSASYKHFFLIGVFYATGSDTSV